MSFQQETTDRERAALAYAVANGLKNWTKIYLIARDDKTSDVESLKSLRFLASRWKCSERIQTAYQEEQRIFEALKERERRAAVQAFCLIHKIDAESLTTTADESAPDDAEAQKGDILDILRGDVDFLDRDQFLQFLSKEANATKDAKARNEILKMLSDNLRYKETGLHDQTNDIQRFYTPIKCKECPLYKAAKEINQNEIKEEKDAETIENKPIKRKRGRPRKAEK